VSLLLSISVGDPEPDQDPHVFWVAGSGSISQRYGSGSGSFPFQAFFLNVLSGLKYCLHSLSHRRKESDPNPDPDPLVRGDQDPHQKCHGSLTGQHCFLLDNVTFSSVFNTKHDRLVRLENQANELVSLVYHLTTQVTKFYFQ
jgi:hypothetical protein